MTSILIYFKRHYPWLWRQVERINGRLFGLLYPDLETQAATILNGYTAEGFRFSLVHEEDLTALTTFLNHIPAEQLVYFHPHPFDQDTLERLLADKAFLMMKITIRTNNVIVGYFFLRCFFIGKAFIGRIVDEQYRCRGLGTTIRILSMNVCQTIGLRMLATVSIHNNQCMRSTPKSLHVRIVKKLTGDYQLIELTRET